MSDLEITWVSQYDKQRCMNGLLMILSWAIERKVKMDGAKEKEVISFPSEVKRRLILHERILNERGFRNGSIQKSGT